MPRKIQEPEPPVVPFLLDVPMAARYLGITPRTLDVWRCTNRYPIPYLKVGGCVRYRKADLDVWLESRTHGRASEGAAA